MNMKPYKTCALVLACLLAAVMLCTACSLIPTFESSSAASSEAAPTPATEEESSEMSSSAPQTGLWSSVGEYLEDPSVVEQIDAEIAAAEGTGLAIAVYADGNTLVYDYTYAEQLDLSDETTKPSMVDALKSGIEAQAAAYENIAAMLRSVISADDIKVRLTYNNADGSEIYSCEFE